MSLEWNSYTIGESCELITGFPFKSKYYLDEGLFKVVRGDNVKEGFIKWDDKKRCWNELNDKLKKVILKEEDIVIGMDGSKLGKNRATISKKDLPALLAQRVACVRAKEGFDQNYIKYVILSNYFKSYVDKVKTGTSIPHISLGQISEFTFEAPDYKKQKTISSILSTIDKKITVNQEINKNLEEQIETIYNSFFVYYDDFSKEELEECEIGLIPKDWELMSLGEVTTKIKEKVGSDDYKVFSAVNTGNLILSEEYFDKQVYSKNIEKYIVVKQKEFAYNPARINIGSIGRNDFNYDGCVSPVYVAFKVEEGYENFMNMYIKSNRFNQWVVTLSSGSVRQTLNYADFSIIKIVYPPKDLVNKFNKVYDNYYEVINYNNSVISNLENIRDTLLPKLMSGEIDVSKINCDLELKYNYMKYLFNQIHTPMSKSVV